MDTKEIKINVPEGYEIDQENSTFECIKFKPVQRKLPKTWEEFCKIYSITRDERWITRDSSITDTGYRCRGIDSDRNLYPNRELAEAALALCQLLQLRDCYNDGWKPDWTNEFENKSCILIQSGKPKLCTNFSYQRILAFKTEELGDQFLENFQDLIEIAKPLL